MRFKKGDVVELFKVFFNGTLMHPIGIKKDNLQGPTDYQHRLFRNFKEGDVGLIVSGPYYDYDCMMWELFIDNDFWFIDDIHIRLLNENDQTKKI